MTTSKFSSIAATLLAAGLLTAALPARADCDGCYGAIVEQGNESRSYLGQKLDDAQMNIVQAINASRDAIKGAISGSATAVSGQVQHAAQATSETQINTAVATAKDRAAKRIAPMSCPAGAASAGAAGGGAGRTGAARPGQYVPANISQNYRVALDQAGQTSSPALPPKDAGSQAAFLGVGGCETFGDPNSPRGQMCALAGYPASGTMTPFPDADIRSSSLLDGPQKSDSTTQMLSVPLSGPARDARAGFLASISTPIRPETPSGTALQTPAGRAYLGRLTTYDALKDLALHPSREFDRLTTADASNAGAIATLEKDPVAGPFTQKYMSDHNLSDAGVSPVEMMEIETERRIGNPAWVLDMSKKTSEEKIADLLALEAYQARVRFQQLQATRETNVLLGALLSQQVETSLRPKLDDAATALQTTAASLKR